MSYPGWKPLLSHNEESMIEHRKPILPETSRWLVNRFAKAIISMLSGETTEFNMIDTIEAWARVREVKARLDESTIWRSILITRGNFPEQGLSESDSRIHLLESTLEAALKKLNAL